MDRLVIPLSAITENGVAVDVTVPAAELKPQVAEELPLSDVRVRGTLREVSGEYVFLGRVSGEYEGPCDRCLEPVLIPFDTDVTWSFAPGPAPEVLLEAEADESDEGKVSTYPFEGNVIDLTAQVWEEAVLAGPTKVLCRPDCAGLCPQCGANWNRAACTCQQDETMANKGLAGLADLLPKLKSKPPEE